MFTTKLRSDINPTSFYAFIIHSVCAKQEIQNDIKLTKSLDHWMYR